MDSRDTFHVYDTTLRDGSQREGLSLSVEDKLAVAAPDWPLEKAAATMVSGGFRHLVVCRGRDIVGMLSVRDIVRVSASETVS